MNNIHQMIGNSLKRRSVETDPEPRCPIIETCVHHIKKEKYERTCINGCHSWGNCSYLPTKERTRYRNKYFKKPKDWEKQEIAEKL